MNEESKRAIILTTVYVGLCVAVCYTHRKVQQHIERKYATK